jgi:hypothetical protein
MSKLMKFKRRRSVALTPNPPIDVDLVEYILPGFAAFAATRLATRIAAVQIGKRYPKVGKHAGAVASLGAFGAAWFGAHRVSSLEKYHHPIVVGAGLAALQSLIQIYVPALGWAVSDASPELASSSAAAKGSKQVAVSPAQVEQVSERDLPPGFSEIEQIGATPSWATYNQAFDPGAYAAQRRPVNPAVANAAVSPVVTDDLDVSALLDNSDLDGGDYAGEN